MTITNFPGVDRDDEHHLPPVFQELLRESRRHRFEQRMTDLYRAYALPESATDPDMRVAYLEAALRLAHIAHQCDGLPWPEAFDSVINRITRRPNVDRAGAISEIVIEHKLHESPDLARGLNALLNDDWLGAPDETR